MGGSAMKTTQTGIPIIDCQTCGTEHPATRAHCEYCDRAHLFECKKAQS